MVTLHLPQQKSKSFLSESFLDYKTGNPYIWWGQNKKRFPMLLVLAQHYLCPPATSVSSERLLSAAGNLHDKKRNKILPTKDLLFIQNYFSLVDSGYIY